MHARRENLYERRRSTVDRVRQAVDVAARRGDVFGESPVRVAAEEPAVRAEMRLADAAMKAVAAVQLRIDDDAIARVQCAVGGDDADHFMAHDPRIADRDRAAVDLEISAADAAVRHAHEDVARPGECRTRDLVRHEILRRAQHHGSHGGL